METIYLGDETISKVYLGDHLVYDFSEEDLNINEVPYIAADQFYGIVDIGEEVSLKYYITDYKHKEYRKGDYKDTFTVRYSIDETIHYIRNVQAGDNEITLDNLSLGSHIISLQAIDKYGRKSHRLFYTLKVRDSNAYEKEISSHIYQMKEGDLVKYNISRENTFSTTTTKGLNALIKEVQEKGYKKLILLKGVYAISEETPIILEGFNTFILDMNEATFKLNPNGLDSVEMVCITQCEDTHVLNGTIEGDRLTHNYEASLNRGEWVNGIIIKGGSYNSFENLTLREITGYGSCTGYGTLPYYVTGIGAFELGDIVQGKEENSSVRCTSKEFIPLSLYEASRCKYDFIKRGYLRVGAYLGYQGNVTDNWVYKATFYDENKKYVEEIEGYAYRRMKIPQLACYVRITLFSKKTPPNTIRLFDIPTPEACSFINIYHQNIRCVGMALHGFTQLLVEGCTFDYCGETLAKCAFDAEDGWDLMQDLIFRKNEFKNCPYNQFLACAGHNFIIEDNHAIGLYFWDRTRSYVVRRNTINLGSVYRYHSIYKTGYIRIQDNTNKISVDIGVSGSDDLILRGEVYEHCTAYIKSVAEGGGVKFIACEFNYDQAKSISGVPRYAEFISCTFTNYKAYLSDETIYKDCYFYNCLDMRLHGKGKKTFIDCVFDNCIISSQGSLNALFEQCKMIGCHIRLIGYDTKEENVCFKNCEIQIKDKDFIRLETSTPLYIIGCKMLNEGAPRVLVYCSKDRKEGAEIYLEENTIYKQAGYIISGALLFNGQYSVTLKENKIFGLATLIDEKYKGKSNIKIIE